MSRAYALASELLQSTLQSFAGAGVEVPARHVVYMSPIPADCEQVAVMFNGINPLGDADGLTNCLTSPLVIGFSVIVSRKTCALPVTKGGKTSAPTPESMSTAAEISSTDMDVLVDVLTGVGTFAAATIVAQAPSGGIQTVELDLSLPYV